MAKTDKTKKKCELAERKEGTMENVDTDSIWLRELKIGDLLKKPMPKIGDTIYFAAFDSNFPDASEPEPHEVMDVSARGKVFLEEDMICDFRDPDERLFLTREEAQEEIERLKEAHKKRQEGKRRDRVILINPRPIIRILEEEIESANERERGSADMVQGIAAGAQKAALKRVLDKVLEMEGMDEER